MHTCGLANGCRRFSALLILSFCQLIAAEESKHPSADVYIRADKVIGTVNPLWRDYAQGGESADPEFYADIVEPMRKLHPRVVRFDHVLDYFVDVRIDGGELKNEFTRLNRMLDLIDRMGAEPIVCVSYVPKSLAGVRRGIDPPKDLTLWREVVSRMVRELSRRPRPVRRYEIWNEPNLPQFWGGTLEEFLDLYAMTAGAIRAADPNARVGGAGFAGFATAWIEPLLDRAARERLPLDFLSWHEYNARAEAVRDRASQAAKMVEVRGLRAELILDEWNYDSAVAPGNDDHRAAVYAADHLRHLADSPLAFAPFFEIKDGPEGPTRFWGRWGLLTADCTPKAPYFCLLAHQQLGHERLELHTREPNVDGLATRDGERIIFTLYNRSPEETSIELFVDGLANGRSRFRWRRWLIDGGHSNPALGAPAQLQLIEDDYPLTHADPAAFDREVLLPAQSVSLCELGPAPEGAAFTCLFERVRDHVDDANPVEFRFTTLDDLSDAGIDSVRILDDTGRVLDSNEQNGEWFITVQEPLTARAIDIFFRAEAYANDQPIAGGSAHYRVRPSLRLQLIPDRVPFIAGSENIDLRLELFNQAESMLQGSLTWRINDPCRISPPLPDKYTLEYLADMTVPVNPTIVMDAEAPPAVATLSVSAHIEGAPALNDEIVSEALIVPTRAIPPLRASINVDGRVNEWTADTPTGRVPLPSMAKDLNPFWLAWEPEHLVVAARIDDPEHSPPPDSAGMWQGDSLQLGFDMEWDAQPGGFGYDDNDVEIGLGLTEDGSRAWCWKAPRGAATGGLPLPLAIRRDGRTTCYEVRIPWSILGREPARAVNVFGLCVVLNDFDGQRRQAAMWGAGIAEKPQPWRFLRIDPIQHLP